MLEKADIYLTGGQEQIEQITEKLYQMGYTPNREYEAIYSAEWQMVGIRCNLPKVAMVVLAFVS